MSAKFRWRAVGSDRGGRAERNALFAITSRVRLVEATFSGTGISVLGSEGRVVVQLACSTRLGRFITGLLSIMESRCPASASR
jgi:hypothetical protein